MSQNNFGTLNEMNNNLKRLERIKKAHRSIPTSRLYPLLIIGVQKGGTTTLFDLLNRTDGFNGAFRKEIGYFFQDKVYAKGDEWYFSNFQKLIEGEIPFEATPAYLYYPYVAERIFRFNAKSKLIIVLRDPVYRCLSAWNMFRSFRDVDPNAVYDDFVRFSNESERKAISNLLFRAKYPTFERAIVDDIERFNKGITELEPSFVRRGLYAKQIREYLKFFPIENILLIEQSELLHPLGVIEKICHFTGREVSAHHDVKSLSSNRGNYESSMDDYKHEIKILSEFYITHNKELFDLVGKQYDWH